MAGCKKTRDRLSNVAGSLQFCRHPQLRDMGYHAIHFEQHRYTMLYRVEGTNAYVEAIYHQLQDYENIFADTLNI